MSNFARVQVLNGPSTGFFEIPENGSLSIGRSSECDVVVKHKHVSRKHCTFRHTAKRDSLQDHSSTVTLVNGEAVEEAELSANDVVTVGSTLIAYLAPDNKLGLPKGSVKLTPGERRMAFLESFPPANILGQQSGNTKLLGVLSSREMMDVYLGYRYETRSTTAVKMLSSQAPSHVSKRFEAGSKHLEHLRHPTLPLFHDRGQLAERPFISVGFVDGEDLGTMAEKDEGIDPATALKLGIDILSFLEFTKVQDIVLRNVCPENLMVAHRETAKLVNLDYATDAGETQPSAETFEGASPSILKHRAPEYLNTECEANFLADQFSLASVIYSSISGGPGPWDGDTPQIPTRESFKSDPCPLENRVGELSPFVGAALQVAMSPDPSKRYDTPSAFRYELMAALKAVGGE